MAYKTKGVYRKNDNISGYKTYGVYRDKVYHNTGGIGEGIAYAAGNVWRFAGLTSVLFEASKKELNNPPMRFAPMQRPSAKVLKLPIAEVVHCQ